MYVVLYIFYIFCSEKRRDFLGEKKRKGRRRKNTSAFILNFKLSRVEGGEKGKRFGRGEERAAAAWFDHRRHQPISKGKERG